MAAGGRAIAPSLPGYLPSLMPPDGDVRVARVAEDLLAVLDDARRRRGRGSRSRLGRPACVRARRAPRGSDQPRRRRLRAAPERLPRGSRDRSRATDGRPHLAARVCPRRGPSWRSNPAWLTQIAQVWSPGRDATTGKTCSRDGAARRRGRRLPLVSLRTRRTDALGDVLVPATVVHGAQDGAHRSGPSTSGTDAAIRCRVQRARLRQHWPTRRSMLREGLPRPRASAARRRQDRGRERATALANGEGGIRTLDRG